MDKIQRIEKVIKDDPNYVFNFAPVELVRPPIMRIDDGIFAYNGGTPLLEGLSFSLGMDSKVALLGSNGVGKTTLLKLLIGSLQLTTG